MFERVRKYKIRNLNYIKMYLKLLKYKKNFKSLVNIL